MSWSYNGNIRYNFKDQVRFLIGDIDESNQLIQDEIIDYYLEEKNNDVLEVCYVLSMSLYNRFSKLVNISVGKSSISYSDRAKNYYNLMGKFESEIKSNKNLNCVPYAGGISVSDKESNESNSDNVEPKFYKSM